MSDRRSVRKLVSTVALVWLVIGSSFAFGMVSAALRSWPYPQFVETLQFVAGSQEELSTLWQKIVNDWGDMPLRHLASSAPLAFPASAYRPLDGLPLKADRVAPIVHIGQNAMPGYRLILGTFDFRQTLHAAILLNADGEVINVWSITQNDLTWPHRPDKLILPHGLDVTRSGSIIVAYDAGSSLTKYDYCGRKLWQVAGGFHHSVDLYGEKSLWSWGNTDPDRLFGLQLIQLSVADGAVLRRFTINDIIRANPDIDIFGIRQTDAEEGSAWTDQPFHPNDIEPLPKELARHYPDFEAGDLLVSFRSLNLVFVVDPESLKVKWWSFGLTRRQHDPDWNARGTITVFNNNMHRRYSSIVEIDPTHGQHRALVDGKAYDFYSWHLGEHQVLPNGDVLITSPDQGRIFEVAPDKSVTFDFRNRFAEGEPPLSVSESRFLPLDYFRDLPTCDG